MQLSSSTDNFFAEGSVEENAASAISHTFKKKRNRSCCSCSSTYFNLSHNGSDASLSRNLAQKACEHPRTTSVNTERVHFEQRIQRLQHAVDDPEVLGREELALDIWQQVAPGIREVVFADDPDCLRQL